MDRLDQLSADTVHLLAGGHINRIFGPPGTGKTTTLAKSVCATALEHGRDTIAITSFTNTSANAIADKAYEVANGNQAALVPRKQISTLHSFGYRAIRDDGMVVALDPPVLADWNAQAPHEWQLTSDSRKSSPDMAADAGMLGGDGDGEQAANGDQMLAALDMARATLTPERDWPPALRAFSDRWTAWKDASGAVDFGDMIHGALERALDGEAAPGRPEVFIVDEAQDLTPAEIALALAWMRHGSVRTGVFAGDDDQAINEWRGGSAEPLLDIGLDADGDTRADMLVEDRVLEQSYRIPSSVHAVAERLIRRVTHRREKNYHPRDEVGRIHTSGLALNDPRLVDTVARDVADGKSVMILASCGYQLKPVLTRLRSEGIPFHNSYRPLETNWNPLRPPARGMSVAQRLSRYLVLDESHPDNRFWTGDDVRAWMEMVSTRSALLAPGANAAIDLLPAGEVPYEMLNPLWFNSAREKDAEKAAAAQAGFERAVEPDLEWLLGVVTKTYGTKLAYPAGVARRFGPAALEAEPLVTVGTTHSVKGGGADCVYISPDLSTAAAAQWHRGSPDRDQIIRQFYVAMTRAQQRCVLLQSTGRNTMTRRYLVPQDLEVRGVAA